MKKQQFEIDFQRQNYIADIRATIESINSEIASVDSDIHQIQDLLDYCKENKLRKFRKRVVKKEMRLATAQKKFLEQRKAGFIKLLCDAERYAPGKGWRR